MKDFNVNDGFLYILAGLVVLFVLAQSVFFLAKAWRRAREMQISSLALRRTVLSSAVFTVAPAAAILLGVITLSKFLGLPLPWLRMSVIGAITYELPAASSAASVTNTDIGSAVTDPRAFATIAWVMTLGIIPGIVIIAGFLKKIQSGLIKIGAKDKRWGEILMSALFLGMISAFLGMLFAEIRIWPSGWIPLTVALVSALAMAVLGTLCLKLKITWLENYALPFSMLIAMAASIPITFWMSR